MKSIKLSEAQQSTMRQFYQDELQKTLEKLEHIKAVLSELGDDTTNIAIKIETQGVATPAAAKVASPTKSTPTKVASTTKKRQRPAGAGRKATWGPFIIERLTAIGKPVTYDQLTADVMQAKKLPNAKLASTKQAIVNTTFRMRNNDKSVNTFSAGSKEKLIGLADWFNGNKIKKEFAPLVETPEKAKKSPGRPKKVSITKADTSVKKGPGRPKASASESSTTAVKKRPGRPKAAASKSPKPAEKKSPGRPKGAKAVEAKTPEPAKKKPGRPKRSKAASPKAGRPKGSNAKTPKKGPGRPKKAKA